MTQPGLSSTGRTRLGRMKKRGVYERAVLDEILAAGFLCHLGVILDGCPMVVPTVYGATEDTLYFHGSVASPSLRRSPGTPVCVTVAHLDGVVIARSVFDHGINYRSAMIFGVPRALTDPAEKRKGLEVLVNHVVPGQWDYARQPNRKELAATTLLALSLAEASVKIRTGPPSEAMEADADLDNWAGVVPVRTVFGDPIPDPTLHPSNRQVPEHIRDLAKRRGES